MCSRNEGVGSGVTSAIKMMLEGNFYVPVIRSVDNSAAPFIGEPFTEAQVPDVSRILFFLPNYVLFALNRETYHFVCS